MSDIYESIEHKGYTIQVLSDNDPLNPRTDWDNLGTMCCWHRRYDLGDTNKGNKEHGLNLKHPECSSLREIIALIEKEIGELIVLPLYLYDHSGITMNTTGFSSCDGAGWDTSAVGFIYISKAKARKEYNWKVINKARATKLREYLLGEVNVYDDYISGNAYGYKVLNPAGEEIDSCWGYFGSDHKESGLLEAAQDVISYDITHTLKTVGVQQELALA